MKKLVAESLAISLNEADERSKFQKVKDATINPLKGKMTKWKGGSGEKWSDKDHKKMDNKGRMEVKENVYDPLLIIKKAYEKLRLNKKEELINIDKINSAISKLEDDYINKPTKFVNKK